MRRFAVVLALLLAFAPSAAQLKYGVSVIADKGTDFAKIKSYTWQSGWDANDKKAHALIVAAIDRELKALGVERRTAAPADVVVKYAALRRIDVEANVKGGADTARRQLDVGSLLVLMLDPSSGKELMRARLDKPIELDPDKAEATINSAVTEIFAKYPTRTKK